MEHLENFIAQFKDKTICVAAYDLETGKEIRINADDVMHPASIVKVPIMAGAFHQAEAGLLSLDDKLEIYNSFKSIKDGSEFKLDQADDGEQTLYQRIGQTESVRELTRLMIVFSSNLATNILIDKIGTVHINDLLSKHGIDGTKILRGMEDKIAYRAGINNSSSAGSSTHLLRLIAEGKIISQKACDEMIQIMFGQEYNESIPKLLPKGTKVAHKTGWAGEFFHDIGIVFPPARKPYVISLFTRGFPEDDENQAHNCMAEISRIIHSQFVTS